MTRTAPRPPRSVRRVRSSRAIVPAAAWVLAGSAVLVGATLLCELPRTSSTSSSLAALWNEPPPALRVPATVARDAGAPEAAAEAGSVRVAGTRPIAGLVRRSDGEPVGAVDLLAIPTSSTLFADLDASVAPSASALWTAATHASVDGAGSFSLQLPEAESYVLVALGPRIVPTSMLVAPHDADVAIEAPAAQELRGTVLDRAGRGIPGATLQAVRRRDATLDPSLPLAKRVEWWTFRQSATTDGTGAFALGGLDEGPFTVIASAPGYATAKLLQVAPGAGTLDVTLEAGGSLVGFVRDGQGNAIPGAGIAVARLVAPDLLEESSDRLTDAMGSFSFDDVLAGGHRLCVRVVANGYATQRFDLDPLFPGEARQQSFSLERGAALQIVVLGADGEPRPDAIVEAYAHRGRAFVGGASTNADGRARIEGASEGGHYRVLAIAPGHSLAVVPDATSGDPVVVRLGRAFPVTGTLVDRAGVGLRGRVTLRRENDREAIVEELTADTDELGAFRFEDVQEGVVSLRGAAPGFASAEIPSVAVGPESPPTPITLAQGVAWTGRILGADGQPLPSGTVAVADVTQSSGRIRGTLGAAVALRADGSFELTHVPSDSRALVVGRSGSSPRVLRIAPSDSTQPSRDLGDITLAPGGSVAGLVLDAKGFPAADVSISLCDTGTLGAAASSARTGSDGRFRIDDVPPGSYSVDASDPRQCVASGTFRRTSVPVSVSAGGESFVVLDARKHGRVRGVVRVQGLPPSDEMEVALCPVDGLLREASVCVTTFDGSFELSVPHEGRFTLELRSLAGFAIRNSRLLNLGEREDREVVIDVGRAGLEGIVASRLDRRPVPGARVLVEGSDGSSWLVVAGPDGRFHIEGLDASRLWIAADAPGFARSSPQELQLGATDRARAEVFLDLESALRVRALDPAGRPAAGVHVSVWHSDGRFAQETSTDGAGEAWIDSLAAGLYAVVLHHSAFEEQRLEVLVGRQSRSTQSVELRRGGAVVAALLDALGQPIPYLDVRVTTSSGAVRLSSTDAQGAVRFDALAEGTVRIEADGFPATAATVKSGETVQKAIKKE